MTKKHESRSPKEAPLAPKGKEVVVDLGRELTKAENYFSVYANDFQVHAGPWDIRMIFGEIGDSSADGSAVIIKQLGEMRMSPQIAKRLTRILIGQLQNYEKSFGQIPDPQG